MLEEEEGGKDPGDVEKVVMMMVYK